MDVMQAQFGSIKKFLLAWIVNGNPEIIKMWDKFMGKGVQMVVDTWLPMMDEKLWDISSLMQIVGSRCNQEAAWLMGTKVFGASTLCG
jgi:hypothetical protein